MISSKDDGSIVGFISRNNDGELVDLNEAILTTSAEESLVCNSEDGTRLVFSSKIDSSNGQITWYQNENDDLVLQKTIGMSQMKSMLSDLDRNNVYENAIKRCINNFITKTNTSPSVLDIGTGTGLLSMFCTRHNAKYVTGCEMFETMAGIAEDVISKNGLDNKIHIIPQKSTDIDFEYDAKADILVSELLDSVLLGESCIYSHGDAISRLLNTTDSTVPLSERIIPYDADVYATLIESNDIQNMHEVSKFSNIYNINPWRSEDAKDCKGGWSLIPVHWESLQSRGASYLSSAKQILNVNFTKAYNEEVDKNTGFPFGSGCYETDITVDREGSVDGILLWWKLKLLSPSLDPDESLCYSTEPGTQNWQDHWLQVVYPLPKSIQCQRGDILRIKAFHDVIKISIDVNKVMEVNSNHKRAKVDSVNEMTRCSIEDYEVPQCSCGWHFLCSTERISMLNDSRRGDTIVKAVNALVSKFNKKKDQTAIMLNIGDGSLISLIAAVLLNKMSSNDSDSGIKIVSKEAQQMSRIFHDQLIEVNQVENVMMTWDGDNFDDILDIIYDDVNIESNSAPSCRIVYALVSECFNYQLMALPVWSALQFYYERISLNDFLMESAIICPSKGYVMAAAFELKSLHISHGNAGVVNGFDHSPLDERQSNWHQNLFPFNLGKYEKRLLTKPIIIAELDYIIPNITIPNITTEFLEEGRVDCVAIWVDYNLLDDNRIQNWNGNDFELHYKSNIKFFSTPINVTKASILQSDIQLDDNETDFLFNFIII